MQDPGDLFRNRRVVAIVRAPERKVLVVRAAAAAEGGVPILALPVNIPFVAEIAAEIADAIDVVVGLSGVVEQEHLNVALAAGAEFVISPIFDEELVKSARQRGLEIVPCVATPTEFLAATRAHEGPVGVWPASMLGGPEFIRLIVGLRPSVPVVALGGIGPDGAPQYIEAGACAVVVDTGLFPEDLDPSSSQIIAVRAGALAEMCDAAIQGERQSVP